MEMAGTSWGIFFPVASPYGKRPGLAGGAWEGRQRGKHSAEAPSLSASCLISTSSVISIKDFNNHFPHT